ncbi:MAG: hypothetical protein M1150_04320 [Patescibacteria group bacterium]|nr:hypothetical protein [Patescibacteria group bacterium]
MKTTIIPAQITTVEDKIAGNLNSTQLMLLMIFLFSSAIIYLVLPPRSGVVLYKIILSGFFFLVCVTLAIRIKGKIVLEWLKVTGVYNLRPKYYLFNKNDLYLREVENQSVDLKIASSKNQAEEIKDFEAKETVIDQGNLMAIEKLISGRKYKLAFIPSTKGGLNVVVNQIKR